MNPTRPDYYEQLLQHEKQQLDEFMENVRSNSTSSITDDTATYVLITAYKRCNVEVALAAIATGKCDINAKTHIGTILNEYCVPRVAPAALALIEAGAIITGPELHSACHFGLVDVFRALVNAGADVEHKNRFGKTVREVIMSRLRLDNYPVAELLTILDNAPAIEVYPLK